MVYDKYNSSTDTYKTYYRESTNSGESLSDESIITENEKSEKRPHLLKESNGTIWLLTQTTEPTAFSADYKIYQQNITYRKSSDNGNTWTASTNFTNYPGFDGEFGIYNYDDKPLISFLSDRWFGLNQIWLGQVDVSQDNDNPPVLYSFDNSNVNVNEPIFVRIFTGSTAGIQKVELLYKINDALQSPFLMYDDGNHNDGNAGDNIWCIDIGPFNYYDKLNYSFILTDKNSTSVTFQGNSLIFPALPAENKWLSAGSFQNWYSSGGCEIEEGYEPEQQYGSRWPGISENQDMQVAKGFWIGAKDFTDENGKVFPLKLYM